MPLNTILMVQTLVHDWSLQQKRELSGNERWGVGEDHPTASTGFSCVCVCVCVWEEEEESGSAASCCVWGAGGRH